MKLPPFKLTLLIQSICDSLHKNKNITKTLKNSYIGFTIKKTAPAMAGAVIDIIILL